MELTTDLAMWSLITGFGMPLLIAFFNQTHWKGWVRGLVTLVLCVIAGGITAYLNDAFTGRRLLSSILLVFVAAIAFYRLWWRPTGIAPAIEDTTTIGSAPNPRPLGTHRPL